MVVFSHRAGTVPFFHNSLRSSMSVFLAAGLMCLIMSFVTPSGPGAFLHFNCTFHCWFNLIHGDGLAHAVV